MSDCAGCGGHASPRIRALQNTLDDIASRFGYSVWVKGSWPQMEALAVPWADNVGNPRQLLDALVDDAPKIGRPGRQMRPIRRSQVGASGHQPHPQGRNSWRLLMGSGVMLDLHVLTPKERP